MCHRGVVVSVFLTPLLFKITLRHLHLECFLSFFFVYVHQTQQQDVSAFPKVDFDFLLPFCSCIGTHRLGLLYKATRARGQNERMCCYGEVHRMWESPLRITCWECEYKRSQDDTQIFKILEFKPFCFVCIALTKRFLKLHVTCLAQCRWECQRTLQIRLWVPLCWSGSPLLWPWKLHCPAE